MRQPSILMGARLVASEHLFRAKVPWGDAPLVAKPDQVYWIPTSDTMLIVQNKTGGGRRVNRYEQVQMSVERVVLQRAANKVVQPVGLVRSISREGKVHYKRVGLLQERELESLYRRYVAVRAGQAEPRRRRGEGCGRCRLDQTCLAW